MSEELKRSDCPFCGENELVQSNTWSGYLGRHVETIECKCCGASAPEDKWNTRPPVVAEAEPVSAAGLLKRLVDAEPYLTDKVHYTCDSAGDYRTYYLELYIPTPAAAPEPFEIAAAKWIGTAPPASGAVPVHLRSLLERIAKPYEPGSSFGEHAEAVAELRALLAKGVQS